MIAAEKIKQQITVEFATANYLNMGHDYKIECILNVNWCSLDVDGGQAKARSGDLRSTKWVSTYGRPRTGQWLKYKLKIDMEEVA